MFTIGCVLYSTFAAKYSTHQAVCTLSRLDSVKSSVTAVLDINAYIFESRYLRLFCRNTGHTMRVIYHICCRIQGALTGLRCVNSGPCDIHRNCCFTYSVSDIWIEVAVWCVIYICRVDVKIWVRVRGVKRIPIGARRDHYAIGEIFTSANMTMMELDK